MGIWVKLAAAFLFVVAVSTYRWNFLVINIDDGLIHLMLFWMLLLPVGHTLALPEFLADPGASVVLWRTFAVPGLSLRLLLFNLALVYVTAGLWKWTSPMWRDGTALYAALRNPISHAPDFWQPVHLPVLKLGNYLALVLEPLFPLMFLLPTNAWAKWLLLAGLLGFHVGILATMKIPYANLAMVGATVIIFGNELMQALLNAPPLPVAGPLPAVLEFSELLALFLVTSLTLMLVWQAASAARLIPPLLKGERYKHLSRIDLNPFYVPLWLMGLAQSYRLFDWIDSRNYHVNYDVVETAAGQETRQLEARKLFPHTTRHVLLQSYLFGNLWRITDPARLPNLRRAINMGYARRYCQLHRDTGLIEAYATVQRVTSDNLSLNRGVRRPIMTFACRDGEPIVHDLCLNPGLFDRDPQASNPESGSSKATRA